MSPTPPTDALLEGERVTLTKRANAMLDPRAFGLPPISQQTGGLASLGGHLHLTQWRVIFVAGSLNRIVGSFSLQLPDIVGARKDSVGNERTIGLVLSDGSERQFLVWGIPSFLTELDAARERCVGEVLAQLQARAAERPDLLESHLQVSAKVAGWFARGPLHWVTRGAQRSSGPAETE